LSYALMDGHTSRESELRPATLFVSIHRWSGAGLRALLELARVLSLRSSFPFIAFAGELGRGTESAQRIERSLSWIVC